MGCGAFSRHPVPDTPAISRQALGRIARLGDLYDAATDSFCEVSIFRKPLPADSPAVHRTDNKHSDVKFTAASSLEEKFRELSVPGDLQLSVLAGMCDPDGSGNYLEQKNVSFKSVECSLIHHSTTVTERLDLFDELVKSCISENAIRRLGATHVVVKIDWGARCAITVRDKIRANESKYDVQQDLLKDLASTVSRSGKKVSSHSRRQSQTEPQRQEGSQNAFGERNENNGKEKRTEEGEGTSTPQPTNGRRTTSVEVSGDVLPDEIPETLDGAQAMMQELPKLIKKCNDGKGKPLAYVMLPLSVMISSEKRSQRLKTLRRVDDTSVKKVVRLFDRITELRRKVYDRVDELKTRRDQVSSSELEEARRLAADLEDHQDNVKCELSQLLAKIRSGKKDVKCLDKFCNKHEKTLANNKCKTG